MAKYKHFDNKQMGFMVVNFKEQLVPGTFEYALNDIIENRINLSCFEAKLNNDYKGASAKTVHFSIFVDNCHYYC